MSLLDRVFGTLGGSDGDADPATDAAADADATTGTNEDRDSRVGSGPGADDEPGTVPVDATEAVDPTGTDGAGDPVVAADEPKAGAGDAGADVDATDDADDADVTDAADETDDADDADVADAGADVDATDDADDDRIGADATEPTEGDDPFEPAQPIDADPGARADDGPADADTDADVAPTDADVDEESGADGDAAVDDYVEIGVDVDDYVDLGSTAVAGTDSYVDAESLVPDPDVEVGAGTDDAATGAPGITGARGDATNPATAGVEGAREPGAEPTATREPSTTSDPTTATGPAAADAVDASADGRVADAEQPSIDLSAIEAFDATDGFDWVDELPDGPGEREGGLASESTAGGEAGVDAGVDGDDDDPADAFAAVTGFDPGPGAAGDDAEGDADADGWTLGGSLDGNVTRVTASTDVGADIGEDGDPPPDIEDVDASFGDGGGLDPDNITRATGTGADEAVERLQVFSSRGDRNPTGTDGTGLRDPEGDRSGGLP